MAIPTRSGRRAASPASGRRHLDSARVRPARYPDADKSSIHYGARTLFVAERRATRTNSFRPTVSCIINATSRLDVDSVMAEAAVAVAAPSRGCGRNTPIRRLRFGVLGAVIDVFVKSP